MAPRGKMFGGSLREAERIPARKGVFAEGLPGVGSGQDAPLFFSFHPHHDPVSWGFWGLQEGAGQRVSWPRLPAGGVSH